MEERPELSLLCRVGDLLCALPLEHVEETMRPMPVEAIAGLPSFVRGLAVVRGAPIPVVDAASLLSGDASDATRATRFVTVKTGSRRIALMVDAVVGVVPIPRGSLDALPLLFQDASLDMISAVGTLDANLLLVLRSARLVREELWAVLEPVCASP
jgi:purine-binding chemotaxis protein CheW